jgi:gamma-polyglutamate synthase
MVTALIIMLIFLVVLGIREHRLHKQSLSKIAVRVHINGSRGKSSVVRLVAGGLRAGGLKTVGKTTGSAPRIIDFNGKDQVIHRLRSASIGEQVKSMRYFATLNPEILVMECMAVQPQYQWVAEHEMIKSTINVITNVRPDHLDEMGPTMDDIARSLGNTIPYNGTLITAERDMVEPLKEIAKSRNSNVEITHPEVISNEFMEKFSYLEHKENVALALKVCEQLGVNREVALNGMLSAPPDPGALFVKTIKFNGKKNYFINAFAANDPQSTLKIWSLLHRRFPEKKVCVFLNSRDDRKARTSQMLDIAFNDIQPGVLVVRGNNLPITQLNQIKKTNIEVKTFANSVSPEKVIEHIMSLDDHIIFGIGNIVGWGDNFVKKIVEYK